MQEISTKDVLATVEDLVVAVYSSSCYSFLLHFVGLQERNVDWCLNAIIIIMKVNATLFFH